MVSKRDMNRREIVTTCTRDCTNTCGLVATVEGGRVTGLKGNPNHPYTRGRICHKAAGFLDRVYSPERVRTPLRKRGGKWHPVMWDTALDEIAERMKAIRARSGPEAILYYQGYGERTALKLLNERFFNLFGGVTTLKGSLCGGTGQAAQEMDLGDRISHDPADHENSAAMILWGRNPAATNIGLVPVIGRLRKRGGSVVLIDPVTTESAALADLHLRPKPGTDAFLAMAAARMILEKGGEDRAFLSLHSEGVAAFEHILSRHSTGELAEKCDVPISQIALLSDILLSEKPAATLLGWGLHRWEHAHHAVRAIDALAAIAGNMGVSGGGVSQGFEEYGPYDPACRGEAAPSRRKFLMPVIGREILAATDPPVEMIFVTAGNPACMAPNSLKVAEAFSATDFVVVAGHFLDDTADLADIFLPVTTFLEEFDVVAGFGHNYVGPVNRAIPPVGECRSDFHIFKALSERFDFHETFDRPAEQWLTALLSPLLSQGVTMDDIARGPVRFDSPMVPYENRKFPTPSGKFRFMTEFEPPGVSAEEASYPYHLLSVVDRDHIGSELLPKNHLRSLPIRMNPAEIVARGLKTGDLVRVVSSVGEITATLVADHSVRHDTVVCHRGGWIKAGHGINRLTRDLASRAGDGTPYFETRVDIIPEQPHVSS